MVDSACKRFDRRPRAGTRVARVLLVLSTAGALGVSARSGAAQAVIRGHVVSDGLEATVSGAMVVATSDGSVVARTLTGDDGSFALAVPVAGSYELRVDRIGYRSTFFGPVRVETGGDVAVRIEVVTEPVVLRGLEVLGTSRCTRSGRAEGAIAIVWEEARKALATAQWTAERELYRLSWWRFDRDLDASGRRVARESRERRRLVTAQPFTSWPVDTLVEHGFVREQGSRLVYAAPDANVLLSIGFAETHCFGLERTASEGRPLVGLRFEPVPGRRVPEVAGVLWVDQESGRLQALDYEYVNAFVAASDRGIDAGGYVSFQALPNGTWIVDDWRIRMPKLAEVRDDEGRVMRYDVLGYSESGGTVSLVETTMGEVVARGTGTVEGIVTDSLGAPASDAVVWVPGTELRTVTDSLGRFALSEMLEGTWAIRASDSTLLRFGHGGEEAEAATARLEVERVTLSLPSLGDVLGRRCASEASDASVGGVLAGRVLDQDGVPVPEAAVRATWSRTSGAVRVVHGGKGTESDGAGGFVLCDVPVGPRITASASLDGHPGTTTDVAIGENERGATIELTLGVDDLVASTESVPDGAATGTWLDSLGVDWRANRAILSMQELGGNDSLPGLLADIPGVELRARPSSLLEVLFRPDSVTASGASGAVACAADVYLNGSEVRQRTSVSEIDILRVVELDDLTALEVFRGPASPVGSVDSCGAVLLWVERLRDEDDPAFVGDLRGEFRGLAQGADARLISLALSPGDRIGAADSSGLFEFLDLAPTLYRFDASIPGWGPWTSPVDVRAGATVELVIEVDEIGEADARSPGL